MRNRDLALCGERHALFVDGERDDRGPVTARHGQHQAGALLAVFKVDGVDDGLAGNALERLLDDVGLGRIHQDGCSNTRGDLFQNRIHVTHFVLADDGAAQVEHLRALGHQPLGQRENAVVVLGAHHVAEVLQARGGVHLLGDDDGLRVGFERLRGEGAGRDRLRRDHAGRGPEAADRLDDSAQVFRRGAAAAANDLHAVFGDKAAMVSRQLRGRELVNRVAALVLRQAGVGQHADGHGRVLTEKANRVVHLRRTGGAVETDHIGLKCFEHSQRRANLRAQQHGPCGFQRDLHLKGNPPRRASGRGDLAFARVANGVLAGGQSDLGLQQILAGLDQQHVHAALDQRLGLLAIGRGHGVVADVAQRGQLGGGSDGAGHKARVFKGREGVCHFARQLRGGKIQLPGAILQVVLGQHDAGRAKAVGLDNIAANFEK